MKRRICMVACVLTAAATVVAEGPSAPSPDDVLQQANSVAKNLQAISYEAEFTGDGVVAELLKKASGKVLAARGEDGAAPMVRIEGSYSKPGTTETGRFILATDGTSAWRIDEDRKIFNAGKLADAMRMSEIGSLFPPKFLANNAFEDELNAPGGKSYAGTKTVAGVELDVLRFEGPRPDTSILYYFGKKDRLLHGVENKMSVRRAINQPPQEGTIIFRARNFKTDVKTSPDDFKLKCPEGYGVVPFVDYAALAAQTPNGLLPSGMPAPDFELKTSDGRTIQLKNLRGKVVMLDFWASWCGPCKMAMPGVQQLFKRYEGKPVAIFGVNCREKTESGVKQGLEYMKEKGFTYDQLLDGDEVAAKYLVNGIPCFYLIGPDGKILYSASGVRHNMHEVIGSVIDDVLEKLATTGGAGGLPAGSKAATSSGR